MSTQNRCYAGIGSRETPRIMLDFFSEVAASLAVKGYTLRSGGALGADQAFERGCDTIGGKKEIYLPWPRFEGSESRLVVNNQCAYDMAARFHPRWFSLKDGAKKLQARNCYQVLGYDLQHPSDFILCWTRGGTGCGGTGQAIRIATAYRIPVFDAGKFSNDEEAKAQLQQFLLLNAFS